MYVVLLTLVRSCSILKYIYSIGLFFFYLITKYSNTGLLQMSLLPIVVKGIESFQFPSCESCECPSLSQRFFKNGSEACFFQYEEIVYFEKRCRGT